MKPLYLRGADLSVHLDGPALRIAKDCAADRWFPLQRVSRVISNHTVNWSTSALLACARAGVTVSFLDAEGRFVARMTGQKPVSEALANRLQNLMLRPDWIASYQIWRDAMHRMAIRSLVRRTGVQFDTFPSAKQLRQLFYQEADSMCALNANKRIGQQVQSLLAGMVTQMLFSYGLITPADGDAEWDLCGDFVDILFWDFQLARLAWLESRLRSGITEAPEDREITEFFEKRGQRTQKLASGLIRRFHRWLIEVC
jgi:CRISPR associated protein Cas1